MIIRFLLCALTFFQLPAFAVAVTVQDEAPHVDLPLLEGERAGRLVGINDFKGKFIYVDFWASWCGPCRQSMPFLNSLKAEYAARGFEIVSVNVDTNARIVLEFLKQQPVNYPVLLDHAGKMSRVYNLQGLPVSFIINREGIVVYKHLGFREKDKLLITNIVRQYLDSES